MTRIEALMEAHRRWPEAKGWGQPMAFQDSSGCTVGYYVYDQATVVKGRGSSWEAAFADADQSSGGAA